MNRVPIYNMDGRYSTTTDLSVALANNYIGEVVVTPKYLVNCMAAIFKKPYYKPVKTYYYGTPDEYLKDKFGY